MTTEMTRREALERAAWLLGGAVSAPATLGAVRELQRRNL
jgi:hypothetical protein